MTYANSLPDSAPTCPDVPSAIVLGREKKAGDALSAKPPLIGRNHCIPARWALIALLLLFFWGMACQPALALPPQKLLLAPASVSTLRGELLLNLSLTVDSEDGLRDLLKDGAVLRLNILASMRRERSWWADESVVERDYSSVIRHDPLTRDFELSFPTPDGVRQVRDRNLTRLLHSSWRKLSLPLLPLTVLRAQGKDESFKIVFAISLRHTEVPPWLEKSSLFWSSDVVPQEERSMPFLLPAGNGLSLPDGTPDEADPSPEPQGASENRLFAPWLRQARFAKESNMLNILHLVKARLSCRGTKIPVFSDTPQ